MPYYIYTLSHPITDTLVYVGITKNLRQRFHEHVGRPCGNEKKNAWTSDLRKENLTPSVRVIETVETQIEARAREIYWIQYYLSSGIQLLNITHTQPRQKKPQRTMTQSNRLGKMSTQLFAAQERKSIANGKRYSLYRLAKDTGIDYGHIHRVMHGKSVPSPDVINKICSALDCSQSERVEIITAIYSEDEEEAA